ASIQCPLFRLSAISEITRQSSNVEIIAHLRKAKKGGRQNTTRRIQQPSATSNHRQTDGTEFLTGI
ncbi:MAG: hypothetical protein LBS35_08670, partial [Synergistaceae bacterium]|nr:hypothetical protein [Synergistaceae bacterium]